MIKPDNTLSKQQTYDVAQQVYQSVEQEPYRCVLSLPIVSSLGSGGVLNIDSGKSNAFNNEQDIEFGDTAAAFVMMALDRFYAAGGKMP
jgi:hypothetical protein